jgi:DNA-binding MarR family transcriptional regulator
MDWIEDIAKGWRHEYPGSDTRALAPLVRLARLALLIEAFQSETLGPFELTISDYSVLATLRRRGKPYALNPSQLYTRLQRSSGGMTKILGRLEERGLVRRTDNPDDGRGSLITLTRRGLSLQDRVFNAFLKASQELMSPMSDRELIDADRVLRRMLEVFETVRAA